MATDIMATFTTKLTHSIFTSHLLRSAQGQVTRMVGLLVTFLRSNSTLDPEKLMEALLDEEFPSLLLLPQIPSSHLSVFFSSPNYAAAEGKMGKVSERTERALRKTSSEESREWLADDGLFDFYFFSHWRALGAFRTVSEQPPCTKRCAWPNPPPCPILNV